MARSSPSQGPLLCHRPKAYLPPAMCPQAPAPGAAHTDLVSPAGRRLVGGVGERATLWGMAGCDLQPLRCLVAPEKQGEQGENTARLSRSPFPLQTARASSWGLNIWEI